MHQLHYPAKSTDRDKLTANKLTAKLQFYYSGFVTDFVTKWGFGQDGSKESKNIFRIALFSQSTSAISWFAVSCCGRLHYSLTGFCGNSCILLQHLFIQKPLTTILLLVVKIVCERTSYHNRGLRQSSQPQGNFCNFFSENNSYFNAI